VISGAIPYVKGHGTQNDFVVIPDPDGALDLTPTLVAAICNRHIGLGADGVLRVVRSAKDTDAVDVADQAEWFMDYRNADGSLSEMCGNGVRVFVRYLAESGLLDPVDTEPVAVATRGGVKYVTFEDDATLTVDLGVAELIRHSAELLVQTPTGVRHATGVLTPNPHAVVFVDDLAEAGPLLVAPDVAPAGVFPDDVNVEFVVDRGPAHLEMRVWERGVGETRSCGTGACAAAFVAMRRDNTPAGTSYAVDVPGGRLTVTERSDGHLLLNGPAELVASGALRADWVRAHSTA
jgi:diaminopimelate epimerase